MIAVERNGPGDTPSLRSRATKRRRRSGPQEGPANPKHPDHRHVRVCWVASAGALIYLAGEKKTRFCLPNTRFLLHQPMGGARGPATDIEIEARELIKMHGRLVQIIATETGQSVERVRKDTDRNYWMSASEAIEYGVANKIINSIKDLK